MSQQQFFGSSTTPPVSTASAFLAVLGSTDVDCTGDGTVFVIGSGNPLTVIYDVGGDFDPTGTFTAPVTGNYLLTATVYVLGDSGSAISSATLVITTSSVNYAYSAYSSGVVMGANTVSATGTVVAHLAAGDTVTFTIEANDGGGKVDDLVGSGSPYMTFVSGFLT